MIENSVKKQQPQKNFNSKLTGQVGEHLVCSELGLRGFLSTPFAGNVPEFDLIVADRSLNTLPIQVKTITSGSSLRSVATNWINIEIDHNHQSQIDHGNIEISNQNLIYIIVMLRNNEEDKHRFFILTKKDVQKICADGYRNYMSSRNWKRPKNYASLDCSPPIHEFMIFENNWGLIEKQMSNKKDSLA